MANVLNLPTTARDVRYRLRALFRNDATDKKIVVISRNRQQKIRRLRQKKIPIWN